MFQPMQTDTSIYDPFGQALGLLLPLFLLLAFIPPVYTAPTDILAGIDDPSDRSEGVNILMPIAAPPPELGAAPAVALSCSCSSRQGVSCSSSTELQL